MAGRPKNSRGHDLPVRPVERCTLRIAGWPRCAGVPPPPQCSALACSRCLPTASVIDRSRPLFCHIGIDFGPIRPNSNSIQLLPDSAKRRPISVSIWPTRLGQLLMQPANHGRVSVRRAWRVPTLAAKTACASRRGHPPGLCGGWDGGPKTNLDCLVEGPLRCGSTDGVRRVGGSG